MADVRTNFIAGRMNKSVDERLVPLGEYIDAQNVRLGSTESTEIGAVENSKGNTQLTFLQFSGTPLDPANTTCLGVYEDGMEETLYWFVHNHSNALSPTGKVDMIISFNSNNNVVTYHIVSIDDGLGTGNTTLNFDPKYLITGVDKLEDLLFFTDNLNAPRVINVTRNYNSPTAGVDGIIEEDINVILKPPGFEDVISGYTPLSAPLTTLEVFPGEENYMETRFLCFAYRYRYEDGGYSATSLFTMPAFQPGPFRFDLDTYNNAGMKNRFNGVVIEFSTGSKRVKEIDLLYKESGSNVIYVIERYNKADLGWADNNSQTLSFLNSKIYTTLGSDELLRLYDNVPRVAKAQTIQGNRLVYGNYVDGYNIENANGFPIPISYTTSHVVKEIVGEALDDPTTSTGVSYNIGNGATTVQNSKITFNLSGLTLPIEIGLSLSFSVAVQSAPSASVSGGNPQATGTDTDTAITNSNVDVSWTFTAAVQYASINDLVTSPEFVESIGEAYPPSQLIIPTNLSANGGTVTDRFNRSIFQTITGTGLEFINSSITSSCSVPAPPATATCTPGGFDLTTSSTGFSLQVPAVRYFSSTGPSNQYEFFNIVDFNSNVGYFLTADTYSLHSNRDYETGIVYMDDYDRASTVLVANANTIFVPPINSVDKNQIEVNLSNLPPYWATKYKFVVKPSEGDYFTVYANTYFEQCGDPSVFWFKLEGDNTNIVTTGMNLIVKRDTSGALSTEVICKVLEVKAFPYNDNNLCIAGSASNNPAGLYMSIKPSAFQTDVPPNAIINYGNKTDESNNNDDCNLSNSYNLNFPTSAVPPAVPGTPYDLPAGSSIRIRIDNWRGSKGSNCIRRRYFFDKTFTAGQDYPTFLDWWHGDGVSITNGSSIGSMSAEQFLNGGIPYTSSNFIGWTCWVSKFYCYTSGGGLYFRNRSGIKRCGPAWDKRPAHVGTRIEVTRGGQLLIFETQPAEVDPNLFYDASEMLDIYADPPGTANRYHKSGGGANDVNQDATNNLQVTLPFANCYTFGNGVESFRITDSPTTKSFDLGQRFLAVSNQDFKEAHRFAGLTYSGVYSGPANSNNLNEFNLGLVNFKDCETSFGPIQLLHSRETDILCLQEDRISYVLSGKNVITDSTGGGAIASVPEVLGTQIARIEEYGISFNPESFAAWGSDMFFTDTKRGAVINLRGTSRNTDQIQIISQYGMRSWFRDQFSEQLQTQKLGGFDPYMNEYVLSSNNKTIPLRVAGTPCGTTVTQSLATNVLSYTVNVGNGIGSITIPYTVSSGSVTISATWNGTTTTVGPTGSNGTITVNKTTNTPNTIDIEATPVTLGGATADYGITVDCPPQQQLTIVRVVLSSVSTIGEFIHFAYRYNFGSVVSPTIIDLASMGAVTPTEYISQTGIRSVGAFPNQGATVTMQTVSQGFDDFDFNASQNKFMWLSTTANYANTPAGIASLLAASPNVGGPISNPSTGVFQSSFNLTGANFPVTNDYLYLIWDLRETTSSQLCYSATSASSACCDCSPACYSSWFGPQQSSQNLVCSTDTNSPGSAQNSWHGSSGLTPVVGDVCFLGSTCADVQQYVASGYYIVDATSPASSSPKKWIEVGANGAVIDMGQC